MRTLGGAAAMVLLLSAAPAGAAVTLAQGGRKVTLEPRLDVTVGKAGQAAPSLTWEASGDGVAARGENDTVEARVTLTADDAGANLDVELRYRADVEVEREAVLLDLPGGARMVGRDLAWNAVGEAGARVDRGTPIAVHAGEVLVTARGGLIAAEARRRGETTAVTLFLDDDRAHPFEPLASCDEAAPRVWRSRTRRKRGERVTATVRLQLGGAFTPLIALRWAAGARAAFVITDHADRTDVDGLRAVLHGTSDPTAANYGKGGFLGHGLRLTRTFFGRKGKHTLDDAEARALADELLAAGSDVGLHSITQRYDTPKTVDRRLPDYAKWKAVTWIDHQPTTNCEGISSQGGEAGKHDIRAILVARGIRWVWSGRDATQTSVLHDLFSAAALEPAPTFYPLPSEPRLWAFRSSWFYDTPERLAAALDDAALDGLEATHGLFIGHTYLAPTDRTTRKAAWRKRNLVKLKQGVATLDARVDAALGRIAARVRAGRMASLTVAEAGERIAALDAVAVVYDAAGAATVENHGATPVKGLTVAVPVAGAELVVDGKAPAGTRAEDGRTVAWFDVPARGKVTVSMRARRFLDGAGRPVLGVTK